MKLHKPKCINENIVILDGLTRSGKFYLGKLLSGIIGLEYFFSSSEVERILVAGFTGVVSLESASALMAYAVNEEIYSKAIGRDMNLRSDDSSSILNSYEKEKYFARRENKPGWDAINKILDENRYSVFILHQSLMSSEIVKGAIPRPYILNIRRHPVDLAFSLLQRGWGRRYADGDLLTFEPTFQYADSFVPYFAIDWPEEYLQSNEYDRVVKSIVYLTEKESNAIANHEGMISHIYYDHLVCNPEKEIDKICAFLKKEPHDSIAKVIKEFLRELTIDPSGSKSNDLNVISDRSDKEKQIYSNIKDKDSFEKLMSLSKVYEKYISV